MCYLNEPLEINHIIIYPRKGWYNRAADVKINIYDSVIFNVSNTQTNANNTIFDAANLGELIYSVDHFDCSENRTIFIDKILPKQHNPITIQCPYKYALSCDDILNEICINEQNISEKWIARFANIGCV